MCRAIDWRQLQNDKMAQSHVMRGSRKFGQRGSSLDKVFFFVVVFCLFVFLLFLEGVGVVLFF